VDAFMCYKQKCKVVSLNLAHPVYTKRLKYWEKNSMNFTFLQECIRMAQCGWLFSWL